MIQLLVDESVIESLESDNITLQNLNASKHVQVYPKCSSPKDRTWVDTLNEHKMDASRYMIEVTRVHVTNA